MNSQTTNPVRSGLRTEPEKSIDGGLVINVGFVDSISQQQQQQQKEN